MCTPSLFVTDFHAIIIELETRVATGLTDANGKEDANYNIELVKNDYIYAIKVKPGIYNWGEMVFTKGAKIIGKKKFLKADKVFSLKAEAGKAYYMGDYLGDVDITFTPGQYNYRWSIVDIRFDYIKTTNEFMKKYRNLADIDMIDLTQ